MYGRSTNDKLKSWSISVDKVSEDHSVVEITHGFVDGKKQVDSRSVTAGKNIGKKNETTPYEQACLEANSMYNKKKEK